MHKVLLPGCSTLERYIARLRSRVEERLLRSLANGVAGNNRQGLKTCWSRQQGCKSHPTENRRLANSS